MEITKNLLKEKFNLFNEKYFENKICDCNFRVEKDNLNLGSFIEKNVSKPIICVSKDDFVNDEIGWTEDRLDNTILHEMIHASPWIIHPVKPKDYEKKVSVFHSVCVVCCGLPAQRPAIRPLPQ